MNEPKFSSLADPRTNACRLDRLLGREPMRVVRLMLRYHRALRDIEGERPVALHGESVTIARRDVLADTLAELKAVAARRGIGFHDGRRPAP